MQHIKRIAALCILLPVAAFAQDVQSQRIYDQKQDRRHDYNHNGRVDRLTCRR